MAKRAAKPVASDPQAVARAKFLEQGTDPVIAKKALEDATAVSRALWLSFLTFGTYLVITFAGVTHRDLLLEEPIVLPVLNAQLPLVTFFWVAPILFVIFHLYLLLSLKLLADQVHSYVGHMEELGLDGDAQDRARLQLPNFVVVQVLGGTSGQVNSWAGRLLSFTAFLTLVAGPLILLLFAQLMFLPYHGWGVTMAQRVMVVVDLVFITYFWWAIKRAPDLGFRLWPNVTRVFVVVWTFFVFMFPGEKFYGALPIAIFVETGNAESGTEITELGINQASPVGLGVFYNTLFLPSLRLVDDDTFKKLEIRNREKNLLPWEGERSIGDMLNNRDFQYANLNGIDLRKANLSNSNFNRASLNFAVLDGAVLNEASLQYSSLEFASLNGASLREALLQHASFTRASMEAAVLDEASLQGASLNVAALNGASLQGAWLQGAWLTQASLNGATLKSAHLHGASLIQATLIGASIAGANLDGADLTEAWLSAASLNEASLQGATIDTPLLRSTSLRNSKLWRSTGRADFSLSNLDKITFLPLTPEAYKALVSDALWGVPEDLTERVMQRIEKLNPELPEPDEVIDWPVLARKNVMTDKLRQSIRGNLTEVACSAIGRPYISQGIVNAHFDDGFGDLGPEDLPLIQKLLAGCPGTEGMNQITQDRLRYLERDFKSDDPEYNGLGGH